MQELKKLVFRLCEAGGTSGDESAAAAAAEREFSRFAKTRKDALGNLTAKMGDPKSKNHILLDAHIDQIGLIVTRIEKNGFLRVDSCGGTDPRILPGTAVTVYGKEPLNGIVCWMPPHLTDGDKEKIPHTNKMAVDIGCSHEEAEKLVRPGDRILFQTKPECLLGERVSSPGLDDRASVAALIRCAQMLADKPLHSHVTFLCSTREEVGGQGAVTGAYQADPTLAIAVDVGFAAQPGVEPENCGKLGGGPMIGFAPVLSRAISENLVALAEKNKMPYKRDVMGEDTGTNSDNIAMTRKGVPTGLISIPLRYMHTPAEVIDLQDVENTARLLAAYIWEAEA